MPDGLFQKEIRLRMENEVNFSIEYQEKHTQALNMRRLLFKSWRVSKAGKG